MENITVERLQEIEQMREETMSDRRFQRWMRELNISRQYRNPEPIYNARHMNSQYVFNKKKDRVGILDRMLYL